MAIGWSWPEANVVRHRPIAHAPAHRVRPGGQGPVSGRLASATEAASPSLSTVLLEAPVLVCPPQPVATRSATAASASLFMTLYVAPAAGERRRDRTRRAGTSAVTCADRAT